MSSHKIKTTRFQTVKHEVADDNFQVDLTGRVVEGQLTFEAFN